jgi:voltage-gated potassium channel Kch
MNQNATPPKQAGLLPWMGRKLAGRRLTARRSLGIIITSTLAVTLAGGVTIRLLDKKDFSSIGEGIWWAVQTVTTVGYGDVVPHSTSGRVIATLVMLTGIAFISLITASVTATLVDQNRDQVGEQSLQGRLDEISARLEAIEGHLEEGRPGGPSGRG